MRSLAYVYGCRPPVSGWDHAQYEHERCTMLWDQLVKLDHSIEREILLRAQADSPEIAAIAEQITELTARLAQAPDDKPIRQARRDLYREQHAQVNAWRKTHKDVVREFETRRLMAVKVARQQTQAWWPNYNRVLQSYDTGRRVARQFGRRLRLHDEERDDGILVFQIQRTATGLGASPQELFDGTLAALQLNAEGSVTLRVDAAGHLIHLPVKLHRDLPANCRVKAAQLTWRRKAHKIIYRLCLTLSLPQEKLLTLTAQPSAVEFLWRPGTNGLDVVHINGRTWSLPPSWCTRMDTLERMHTTLNESVKAGKTTWREHPRFAHIFDSHGYLALFEMLQVQWPALPPDMRAWYRTTRQLWKSLCGLQSHLIGQRQALYRCFAREIVSLHAGLQLPDLDLASIATAERGQTQNSARHRAAIHSLRAELIHQSTKARLPIIDASGTVLNADKDQESSAWRAKKQAKLERSQPQAQPIDSLGAKK